MTTVSPTIYIGCPKLIDLDDEVTDFAEFGDAVREAAETATEVTILGGFYSRDGLYEICESVKPRYRKRCRVRIAVGLDAAASIPRIWKDMRALEQQLLELKFKSVHVAIFDSGPAHFHTKLYRFVHTTHPVWFVGSANPGSARHELMVKLGGRHEALSDYVEAVFARATSVKRQKSAAEIRTLQDFFMEGKLCHKPPPERLFTFDAYHFDTDQRDLLAKALAGSSQVSHASPKTQGFGFNLKSALTALAGASDDDRQETRTRTQFRRSSIDTVFGWWMPRPYAEELMAEVEADHERRAERLLALGRLLQDEESHDAVRDAFEDHVATMETFLIAHHISAKPVFNRDDRFKKFLASRTKALGSMDFARRATRTIIFADMPDIWSDDSAVRSFQDSFFDDFAFRAAGTKKPRVVRAILDWLDYEDLSTPGEYQEAMVDTFEEYAWSPDDWDIS